MKQGILVPLPKPGKPKGPPGNLRPIILLNIIRKILAICLIKRIYHKIDNNIPVTQAAYRSGRSTTELIQTVKLMAEKAITSKSFQIFVLLLDMSKAFDTVNRGTLFKDLQEILSHDELHLISILLKDVELKIRIGSITSQYFKTNIGVPQGDCLSPILFTLYLAKALKNQPNQPKLLDHNYSKQIPDPKDSIPPELQDHTYNKEPLTTQVKIDQQYADDISYITTTKQATDNIKQNVPKRLKERGLLVNETKTEDYNIKRNGENSWKNCKLVGSLLDTEKDIKRRKQLAMCAFQKNSEALTNSKISLRTRVRLFDSYICSIFMYNSETWGITKDQENEINIFQRSLLRKIMKIKWPKTISNTKLYNITKQEEWSEKIRKRRLSWLGHLLRLPENTPVHLALQEALAPCRRPPGKPKTTWISKISSDLKSINKSLNLQSSLLQPLAADRLVWRQLVINRKTQY